MAESRRDFYRIGSAGISCNKSCNRESGSFEFALWTAPTAGDIRAEFKGHQGIAIVPYCLAEGAPKRGRLRGGARACVLAANSRDIILYDKNGQQIK